MGLEFGEGIPVVTEQLSLPKLRPRWVRAGLLTILIGGVVGYGSVTRRQWFEGNFGVVEANRVYRSAQPTKNLRPLIAANQIASVLNLRGGSMRDPWYVDEVATTQELGVAFYDLSMSATKRPSRSQILTLLDLFRRCKYPLLIHCRQGADRTGMAAGLYLLSERSLPPERAMAEFTISHGHVPLFGPEHLHEPFDEYAGYLTTEHLTHSPEQFRDWVEHHYVADDGLMAITPLDSGPRVRR